MNILIKVRTEGNYVNPQHYRTETESPPTDSTPKFTLPYHDQQTNFGNTTYTQLKNTRP